MTDSGFQRRVMRQFSHLPLRVKLAGVFLLISMSLVTAGALIVSFQTRNNLVKTVGTDLKGLANNEGIAAGNLLLHQIDLLQSLSLNEILISKVAVANLLYPDDLTAVQAELAALDAEWQTVVETDRIAQIILTNTTSDELWAFRSRFSDHMEIFITDRYGGLVAATNLTSDYYQADEAWWQEAYQNGDGRAIIKAPQFDESSQILGLVMAVPIYDHSGTVIGILRTTYDLRTLGNLFDAATMEEDQLFVDLLLPNNEVISSAVLLQGDYDMGKETAVTLPETAIRDLQINSYTQISPGGTAYLASLSPITTIDATPLITDLGWSVIARQERQTALTLVTSQKRVIWSLVFLTMGIAVIGALFATRELTRPVLRLTEVAQQIRDGNINIQAPVTSNDEIGELAETFNAMTGRLRHVIARLEENRAQLELRVAERTAELEKQTKMLDVILSTTPSFFLIYNQEGHCIYASPPALAEMELTLEQLIGEPNPIVPPFMPRQFPVELSQVFETGQPLTNEFRLIDFHQTKQYEYALNPVHDSGDQISTIVVTVRDITEQRLSQEALWRSQKMESLGILAGGVAHDFNNLLVALLGQTSVALYKIPPDSEARVHIEKAVKAAERAADLTKQMLAYSGKGRFDMQSIRLNQLVRENTHLFEAVIPKKVQLQLRLADRLPLIDGDPGQMQQVVMNLILNAAEAIGENAGQVVISTCVQTIADNDDRYWHKTNERLAPGEYVCLRVQDDGIGMDEVTTAKIFDPFFTTKFTGRGLGLAAVLGIVRGHKGGLNVISQLHEGTTFELLFPAIGQDEPDELETAVSDTQSISGALLVIDDEAPVREAMIDMLDLEDIRVFTAASGESGIALYREKLEAIDLILLDLSMPGLSGYETFHALRQVNPQAKIILSSGFSEEEVYRQFAGEDVTDFLAKPYQMTVLIEKVQQHLG